MTRRLLAWEPATPSSRSEPFRWLSRTMFGTYRVWRQARIRHGGTEWAAQLDDKPWIVEHAGSKSEAMEAAERDYERRARASVS